MTFPSRENLVICFGHSAYQVKAAFDSLNSGVKSFEARSFEDFERRIAEADVVVVSGFWKNHLLQKAPRLKFIQSISAGINQYDLDALKAGGVRLASKPSAARFFRTVNSRGRPPGPVWGGCLPDGRFVLDRARALLMARGELVHRLG